VLKGAHTLIADAAGACWCHIGDDPGLATSGSGDTLAGVIAGLAARGAGLREAALWGVSLHAHAGAALARRLGAIGYLARELLDELPLALRDLDALTGAARR
jgi:ADP-dependent NAD(P)H-hydrate dehydratase